MRTGLSPTSPQASETTMAPSLVTAMSATREKLYSDAPLRTPISRSASPTTRKAGAGVVVRSYETVRTPALSATRARGTAPESESHPVVRLQINATAERGVVRPLLSSGLRGSGDYKQRLCFSQPTWHINARESTPCLDPSVSLRF